MRPRSLAAVSTASDYVSLGALVYFSDTTGKADDPESGATVSNALYASGVLIGIRGRYELRSLALLVDFQGGL